MSRQAGATVDRFGAIAIWWGAATAAWGWPAPTEDYAQRPHPAVVRIIVPNRDGMSLGSGALVAVTPTHGLVVTNWHVVREQSGVITVAFPDGFRSAATVLRTDRDWDLAALAIWKPNAQPIRLATAAPRPGETLTIAGYGQGSYRASAGRCTQYFSPGGNLPYEIVELGTAAREGDSGGPILNSRGELAGVLFGTSVGLFGRTMGSYCGRVRWFLAPAAVELDRMPGPETLIAQRPQPQPVRAVPTAPAAVASNNAAATRPAEVASTPATAAAPPRPSPAAQSQTSGASGVASRPNPAERPPPAGIASAPRAPPAVPPPAATAAIGTPAAAPEPTVAAALFDQIKSVLAAIGIALLLFHGLRIVGAAAQ